MSVTKLKDAWQRIEQWCQQNHLALLDELNDGATSDQVAAVEAKIQRSLPEDVRESLLLHNGQPDGTEFPLLFGQITIGSCDQIVSDYERWKGCWNPVCWETLTPTRTCGEIHSNRCSR